MGTCTIRDKNFLYREAKEAICLLQCRWGSLAEAPVQRWPFCKGRRALLSLWESLQKWLLWLLALLTFMVFIILWPLTLKLLMFISDCSPMNHASKLCFPLTPPSLGPFLAISSIPGIVSCDQQERIRSPTEKDHVTCMATLHLLEVSSRRLCSGLSKMLKNVRNPNLILCAAPYVLIGLGGLSGSWINFSFKAWDQKSNRRIIIFSWSHIYSDQENKVNVHWWNSHFEFSVL